MIAVLYGTALACFVLGPLLAYFEVVAPLVGFGIFAAGGLTSLIASIVGIVVLVRGGDPLWPLLAPTLAALCLFLYGVSRGIGVPRINDITTDTENPPQFQAAARLPANLGRDMSYPPEFAAQQEAGYGEIAPLHMRDAPPEAFIRAERVARGTPTFSLTGTDSEAGLIEGFDTSALFRFRDDFVIEIRPDGARSVVHMRSKSRVGKGDLGTNAARIRAFLERLRADSNLPL